MEVQYLAEAEAEASAEEAEVASAEVDLVGTIITTMAMSIRTGSMTDAKVYLEKLSVFSRMLRLHELTVSPQETADAARLLTVLGFADREQVKTALRTVFAKSREEQATFDRVFDGFFISEEKMRQQAKEQMQREQELQQHDGKLTQELILEQQKLNTQLKDTISAFFKEFNADKKYSVIFSNTSNDNILYAEDYLNITKEVVEKLNERYSKKKEGAK